MTISAPALARPMAMPRPNPPLPPVTIATLPCRSNSSIMFSCVRVLPAYSPLDNYCPSLVYILEIHISPATRGSIQLPMQEHLGGGRHTLCLPVKLTGI